MAEESKLPANPQNIKHVEADMPDDFKQVNPERAGWFQKTEGAWFRGVLMGRFMKKKGVSAGRYFYQFKLTADCTHAIKKPEGDPEADAIPTVIKRGELLNADECSQLEGLRSVAQSDTQYEVFAKCLEKQELDGGRSFWKMKVGQKPIKEDIPF